MTLKLEELQDMIDKVISDYRKLFADDIDLKKVRTAIGFQISSLKKYEIEGGMYSSRSITVLPKSSRLLDLLLIYNSEYGQIKYELTIRSDSKSRYCIYKNLISQYHEDEDLNIDNRINIAPGLTKRTVKSRTHTVTSNKTESTGRLPPQTLPRKTSVYLCRTKDKHCCYLKHTHSEESCDNCCYDQKHIMTYI